MNIQDLAAPFPVEAVHWRAQTLTQDKSKALALAYIDARDVMDRLDAVVGPANWATTYEETPKGRILCRLSLRIDNEWVMKTDGAGNTDVEGDKGAISDALKRAAVSWGIGRYLYDLSNVWAPCEVNQNSKWRAWKPEASAVFAKALAAAARVPPISEDQRTDLMSLLDSLNFPVADFLRVSKISDLRELRADKFDGAKRWITEQSKQKEAA